MPSKVLKGLFSTHNFYTAAQAHRDAFNAKGKYQTSKNYDAVIARLKMFAPTLLVEEITPRFTEEYRTYLQSEKVAMLITMSLAIYRRSKLY